MWHCLEWMVQSLIGFDSSFLVQHQHVFQQVDQLLAIYLLSHQVHTVNVCWNIYLQQWTTESRVFSTAPEILALVNKITIFSWLNARTDHATQTALSRFMQDMCSNISHPCTACNTDEKWLTTKMPLFEVSEINHPVLPPIIIWHQCWVGDVVNLEGKDTR